MEIQLAASSSAFVFSRLLRLLREKKEAALVTILETSGSTPQIAGAKAVISPDGLEAGTVGGGSFEAAMIERARNRLISREAELIFWSFAAEEVEEGSICGGQALVLIDGYPGKDQSLLEKLISCLERRNRGLLITAIRRKAGEKIRLNRFFQEEDLSLDELARVKNQFPALLFSLQPDEITCLWQQERPKLIKGMAPDEEETYLFLEPVLPPPRLLIFGAGHVGQAVAQLGLFLGFEVYLFDDRADFKLSFPLKDKIKFIGGDMAQSLEAFPADDSCYCVIVTRGHRHDAGVLRVALKKRLGYIGMIGSRRKVALMKEDFLRQGWAIEEDWARVHSPIGLDIGAQTVEEIALSILAEIVSIRRRKVEKNQ